MSTGELQGKALEHPGPVTSLAESRDGSFLLTGCAGGTSRIWEAKTDKLQGSAFKHPKTRDYGSAILAVALSPDGKVVLTGSEDTTVRVWDRETGRQNGKPLQLAGVVHGVSFSPDGVTFLTSSGAETVQLWDTATRSSLATILRPSNVDDAPSPPVEGFVYPWSNVAIAFTPNGQ